MALNGEDRSLWDVSTGKWVRFDAPGVFAADPHCGLEETVFPRPARASFPQIVVAQDLFQHSHGVLANAFHPPHHVQQHRLDLGTDVHVADVRDVDEDRDDPLKVGDVDIRVVRDDGEKPEGQVEAVCRGEGQLRGRRGGVFGQRRTRRCG